MNSPANADDITPGNITRAECLDFINETPNRVICGFISLPRDHDHPEGRRISVPILIAKSTKSIRPDNKRAILIPGAGGPGAAMGFGYQYHKGDYLNAYQHLRQAGYDVIIVDQRGAGFSSPTLNCHETISIFRSLIVRKRTLVEEINQYRSAVASCHRRLTSSIGDISVFNTRQSALDFLAIMDQLSYDWWGTIATSYATALAQAMILIKPDVFNAAVLDSPVPLDYQQPLTSESVQHSIIKTINRCKQSNSCNKKYPDLISKFTTLLSRARNKPYRIKLRVYDESGASSRVTLIVDEHALLSIFSTAIYSNDFIALLPDVITKMHRGRQQALKYFAEDFWYQSTDLDYADGLNLTIHCKERQELEDHFVKTNPGYLDRLSVDSRLALRAQADLCKTWQVIPENDLLPSAPFQTRTLILAGSLDPVISQADITNTANDFDHVNTAVVQGAGHSVWFQSECARENVLMFFNAGKKHHTLKDCESTLPSFK